MSRHVILFFKSIPGQIGPESKGQPAGSRWITVHPIPGGKGQPLLVQPQPDNSMKVLGGAGGSLNHLRLRTVKSESDYKAEAASKRAADAVARKEQRKADKEAGILEAKKQAHAEVKKQRTAHEAEFVQAVFKAAGWETTPPDVSSLSPQAAKKALAQHHRETLKRAKEFVDLQRKRLATDSEARAQAGLGEVPLTTNDPETLTVDDIAPVKVSSSGLGFMPNYKNRAAMDPGELQMEAEAARPPMSEEKRQAAIRRGETAKLVNRELESIRDKLVPEQTKMDLVDAKTACELLKAEKALQSVTKQARAAGKEIDAAKQEPQAFVLEHSPDEDVTAQIKQDLDDELRTIATTHFLSRVGEIAGGDPGETLGRHIGVGAFNSINSLALAASGDALIDRSVVDVLGIAGAAQVLARRLQKDMPDDVEHIANGMKEFHTQTHAGTTAKALTEAQELLDAAGGIELPDGATGTDLQSAQELNAKRRAAVGDAQRILGQVYGEMECNAALVAALGRPAKDAMEIPMKGSLEAVITQARALGLQRCDYSVEQSGEQTWLNVNAQGLDRLAKPVARADLEQVKRNLAIMRGEQDEDGWLPLGVASRPDLDLKPEPGVAPRLGKEFDPGDSGDLESSLRDYIGGRVADGDTPADIVADIQSADFFRKSGNPEAYRAALDAVAPNDKGQIRAEALGDQFEKYADDFTERAYGGKRSTLNKQDITVDQVSVDALHRALAEHPEGVAAYKSIGDLEKKDQRALREFFYREVAKEDPDAAATRAELEKHLASEPEKQAEDMFGEVSENPEWSDWKSKRDELSGKLSGSKLDWAKYTESMRGNENAYATLQDMIKSRVSASFATAHNKLRPDAPIKVGRAVVRNNLNHLDATDPKARAERERKEAELRDSLRERSQGRYAAGGVADKLDAARDQREAFEQSQMGFFADEAPAKESGQLLPDLKSGDERHTLGHAAERTVAGLVARIGGNFKPGQPTKLFNPSMSGGDNYSRQRSIKLLEANKRMGLHLGAGSGKTLVSLGAFTHLKAKGQVKRAIFAVPSIVQGQMGGEALRFLAPDSYKWHCQPGASRAERIAAYKDSSNDFCVVTHQSLRDDIVHLGAEHAGISTGAMLERLKAMPRGERKAWAKEVMDHHGINFDMSVVDEGHNLLDREGKEDSGMSVAMGALFDHTPYHASLTADPTRGTSASEVFSALQKVAPDRYTDRAAFMRKYGADTPSAKDALQREMARHFYAHSIRPDVQRNVQEVSVPLKDTQKQALSDLDRDLSAMRLARIRKTVDVDAAKRVSPKAFEGVPEEKHSEIAKGMQDSIGIVKESAVQRIINAHPDAGKMDELVKQVKSRPGKAGVVFVRSLDSVEAIKQRLEKEGHRVVTISGADTSQEKDRKRQLFQPDKGEAQADILVASDAASVGLNAQRGQFLVQFDTPATATTHAQRRARIDRTGQRQAIDLVDLVADHASERKARKRLQDKYGMREMMTSPLERLDDSGVGYYLAQARAQKDEQAGLF